MNGDLSALLDSTPNQHTGVCWCLTTGEARRCGDYGKFHQVGWGVSASEALKHRGHYGTIANTAPLAEVCNLDPAALCGSEVRMHLEGHPFSGLTRDDQAVMKVTIEDHDPAWKAKFTDIREYLLRDLGDAPIISIEHVGSTAIPGLKAKPVLDVDIIISPSSLDASRSALVKAGYTDCHDTHVPGRYVFRQPGYGKLDPAHGAGRNGELRYNTYIMLEGCSALKNHLDVRRVLMENPELRREYSDVKSELGGMEFPSIHGYVCGKTEILCKILRVAGWSEEELEPLIKANS